MAEVQGHAPFALFNRFGNPLIAGLLRSPLHQGMSGRLALIRVTGRRTGKTYEFPVDYSQNGERVTITVGWPGRKYWWRNLTGSGAPVTMRLRGKTRTGHATAAGEAETGVTVTVELDPA